MASAQEKAQRKKAITEVNEIANAIKADGLYCTSVSDFPVYVNRPRPTDDIPAAAVAALSDDDEDFDTYCIEVRPIRQWVSFVEHTKKDWTEISSETGDMFETLIQKYGYEIGSAGGHPPNFDYYKTYTKDVCVSFAFLGNPYHI